MKATRTAMLRLLLAGALVTFSSACFEVNQTIKLKKNMSGTAAFDFKMDLEPMVYMMAFMEKAMSGGGENPTITEKDLAKARKEFLATQGDEFKDKMGSKEEVASKLPDGVKLKKYKAKTRGTKMSVNALFAFDKVTKLNDVAMGENEKESPMSGLTIEETADTLTISTVLDNPTKNGAGGMGGLGGPGGSPEDMPGPMGDMMRNALNKMRFNIVIDAPFQVVEHNATSQRGNRLSWKIDYAAMKAAEESGQPMSVRVVYKK